MDDRTEKSVVCPQRGAHAFQSRFSREHKHFVLEEEEENHDRAGKPVVCPQRGASRSQEIKTRSFREEAVKHDRTGKPVGCRDEKITSAQLLSALSKHLHHVSLVKVRT